MISGSSSNSSSALQSFANAQFGFQKRDGCLLSQGNVVGQVTDKQRRWAELILCHFMVLFWTVITVYRAYNLWQAWHHQHSNQHKAIRAAKEICIVYCSLLVDDLSKLPDRHFKKLSSRVCTVTIFICTTFSILCQNPYPGCARSVKVLVNRTRQYQMVGHGFIQ
jgi:hypothetical protein